MDPPTSNGSSQSIRLPSINDMLNSQPRLLTEPYAYNSVGNSNYGQNYNRTTTLPFAPFQIPTNNNSDRSQMMNQALIVRSIYRKTLCFLLVLILDVVTTSRRQELEPIRSTTFERKSQR
jgi:hypothetical protein